MLATIKASVATALLCALAGAGLTGCDEDAIDDWDPFESGSPKPDAELISGTTKIEVGGKSVNVSCSGEPHAGRPAVVLLHGGGDGLAKLAALQKTLSKKNRVCSYDRIGAGASDKPDGPQDFASSGQVLTGVLARVAGDDGVVLAGHSLGGLIAARYAPDHQDEVKGLVLLDATPSTMVRDITKAIPEAAKGPAAQVRAQNLAIFQGQNPERLVIEDGRVRPAGGIPVAVVKHGKPYLAALPTYGPRLERNWSAGQRDWLALSSDSKLITATGSGHYIYLEQPAIAVKAIESVATQASQ